MTDTFTPAEDTIDPIMQLLPLAEITDELRDEAAAVWKQNSPDDEFVNLLEAAIENE